MKLSVGSHRSVWRPWARLSTASTGLSPDLCPTRKDGRYDSRPAKRAFSGGLRPGETRADGGTVDLERDDLVRAREHPRAHVLGDRVEGAPLPLRRPQRPRAGRLRQGAKGHRRARRPRRHRARLRDREGPLSSRSSPTTSTGSTSSSPTASTSATSCSSRRSTRSTSARRTSCSPSRAARSRIACSSEALEETGRVGIAKVVIRNKQHLACLRTVRRRARGRDDVLRRRGAEAGVAGRRPLVSRGQGAQGRGRDGEVARGESQRRVRPREVHRHLPRRADGAPPAEGRGRPAAGAGEAEGEVIDLMQALRESVERTQRKRAKRPTAKKAS